MTTEQPNPAPDKPLIVTIPLHKLNLEPSEAEKNCIRDIYEWQLASERSVIRWTGWQQI